MDKICQILHKKHGLTIDIGVELEFYLSHNIVPEKFSELLKLDIQQEKGTHQFEINLPHESNLTKYAEIINDTKEQIQNIALILNGAAYISPKPFKNDYGNSMHVHISVGNSHEGLLDHLAKTLCHFMIRTFVVFMPTEEDYLRINKEFMAPTHISFGNNNRSVAIRIPDLRPKRLEHRVASLSSDPYIVMYTILKSILLGLDYPKHIPDIPKIYGNAYDDQYNMQPFPQSLEEANMQFDCNFLVNNTISRV